MTLVAQPRAMGAPRKAAHPAVGKLSRPGRPAAVNNNNTNNDDNNNNDNNAHDDNSHRVISMLALILVISLAHTLIHITNTYNNDDINASTNTGRLGRAPPSRPCPRRR